MGYLPDLEIDGLMSCPKCNGPAVIQQMWLKGHANVRHFIPKCKSCGFSYHEEYRTLKKAINKWNNCNINVFDIDMYKSMTKDELIQCIINNELIPADQINPSNKTVLQILQDEGNTIVSMKYLNVCKDESLQLAKIKANEYERQKALRGEKGYALWEEEV